MDYASGPPGSLDMRSSVSSRRKIEYRVGNPFKMFMDDVTNIEVESWFISPGWPGLYCCIDPNLCYSFVNDAYAQYYNMQPRDLVGKEAFSVIPPALHPYILQIQDSLNPESPICIVELNINRSEESPLWARWIIRAIYDYDSGLVEYQATWEDISEMKLRELKLEQDRAELEAIVESRTAELQREIAERKRMEEELYRKDKLESLGILASGIAHDFNNILTIISGNSSLVSTILEEKADYEVHELLDEVQRGVMQARELTEQLMTFSRGGAPVKETSSIQKLVQESASFILRGSKVRAVFSAHGQIWPVNIDRGQISQVVSNLIINSSQAMPDGGIIEICINNIPPEAAAALMLNEGRYVQIIIKDHGIGIPAEDLGNIFVPYFTTKAKGHGLGLALAYSIIEKHEGDIKVNSELGVGTTFEIYLPASDDLFIDNPPDEKINYLGQGRILIMDDDEMIRNTLGRMLRQLGYETGFARDGEEAIDIYNQAKQAGTPYQVVIMDLTIAGGMGGKETVQRLKQLDSNLKAIVTSGYSCDEVMINYVGFGFCGAIEKPYEIDKLSRVLYEIVVL